ncbi:gamma-glutamylcyclotransferase family protein [Mesorhizobium sp. M0854]|uniref:gamma-glutamylcyclotransferase family protein n=1 Tax=Mesorhizobium sp. M0854 TaxID=2957013 RepID=UPI00333B7BEA
MALVFGYGSNMDDAQMDTRCPNRVKVGTAVLRGHRLIFPRLSNRRECGVSSIEPAHGHDVWGVVHRLSAGDLEALDRSEGYRADRSADRNGYNRVPVIVELGGVPTAVETYVAVATHNPPPPNAIYLAHIRDGARQHGLPEDYQRFLAGLVF